VLLGTFLRNTLGIFWEPNGNTLETCWEQIGITQKHKKSTGLRLVLVQVNISTQISTVWPRCTLYVSIKMVDTSVALVYRVRDWY
jgi:hypothetical protein